MKKMPGYMKGAVATLAAGMVLGSTAQAQRLFLSGAPDPEAPKGSSVVDMNVGAQIRVIPTHEVDFDMGITENLKDEENVSQFRSILKGGLHPKIHSSEAGRVSNEYWRTEAKMDFSFRPQDGLWGLDIQLECDTTMDNEEADGRCRNFGMERLNASFNFAALKTTLHAGWDIYAVDAVMKTKPSLSMGGPAMVYGDDDPGFWFTGSAGFVDWQVGMHKKMEFNARQNAQTRGSAIDEFARPVDGESFNPDRDVYDVGLTFHLPIRGNLLKLFWVQDQFRNPSDQAAASTGTDGSNKQSLNVVSTYYGLLYHGTFVDELVSVTAQYATQGGTADNTGMCHNFNNPDETGPNPDKCEDDYDISADMWYANVTVPFWGDKEKGIGGKIGLAFLNSSGDGERDDKLEGFTGVVSGSRFSNEIGTESSIIGEQNVFTLGNQLYGYVPEYHGSHGGFFQVGPTVGGFAATRTANGTDGLSQGGRGDNPGLEMLNVRVENKFSDHWVLRLQWRDLTYKEDFYPFASSGLNGKPVKAGNMGNEMGAELYYLMNWNAIINVSWVAFNPGSAMEKVVEAYSGSDETATAQRTAAEFIVRF